MPGAPRRLVLPALPALLAACSAGPPADPALLAAPGTYAVGTRELALVDRARPTPPNGAFAGAPARSLPTRVWYPAAAAGANVPPAAGPFPLIAYAHGFNAGRATGAPFGEHLASHGYIVAAPDFPLSHLGAPGGATLADLAGQPGDLRFVLAAVAEDATLGRTADRARQGLLGLSMGGGTVLAAAYHPTLRLPEIGAVVAQAPLSCAFGPAFYSRPVPALIMAGDADELIRFAGGPGRAFELAPAPVRLLRLRGGTHLGFVGLDGPQGGSADDVGCAILAAADAQGGFPEMLRRLSEGAPAGLIDTATCDAKLCAERVPQGMTSARQLELARTAVLAHLDAALRGDAAAARLLDGPLAEGNPDVELRGKD